MIYKTIIIAAVATACIPLQAFWDFELQKRSYCHAKAVWWFTTYMHVITDFLTYLLPMPIIFSVQFPKRQKILLFILFAFGFLWVSPINLIPIPCLKIMVCLLMSWFSVCLVSLVRLYLLKITADTPDYTFDNVSIAFWSCVETNAAVSVACFMTMKPLITRWFPTLVEERPDRAMQIALSNGRLPTIGSTPMRLRPAQLQRSLTASFRGYEVLAPDHRTKES